MKILQATTARGWSGGTEQCLLLAKYMNKFGVKTDILCFKGTELEKRAREQGIDVRYFPNTKRFSIGEAKELSKIISQYDVVNTHISKAHWFVWLSTFFLKKRPKIVYTRRVLYPISSISSAVKYNLNTDAIISISPEIFNSIKGKFFLKEKVYYIPSGVELNRFNPKIEKVINKNDLGIPKDSLIFTHVANFSKVKGHHILISAFTKLRKKYRNAYLLLVGRDTKSDACLSLIKKTESKEYIIPLGFRKDVPDILRITDIFVFPSLNEGLGSSLLQAMAMKRVVVASYVGGIRSYLKHMENGVAIEPGSVDSLYRGLLEAVENLENERLKEKARKTAENFDIKRVTEETLKLYREILNG